MRLWNEYEGTTLADSFPLQKLIEPEGRSAFFLTTDQSGQPAVIRVIEAHFDEAEILARWQLVTSLDQPHLLKIIRFGHTELDGTPLLYAVMESSEANLAEVLRDRPLTVEETRQVATNLLPALQAIHAARLVHEHIEPVNILAIGEDVKLRSDCVRELPEGPEGQEVKSRDVHGLATVLLQCLTQRRTLSEIGNTSLPAPFNQIIRNGLNGTWGLQQISDLLAPPSSPPVPKASTPAVPSASAASAAAASGASFTAQQPIASDAPKTGEARNASAAPVPQPDAPHSPLGRSHIPDEPSHTSFLENLEHKPLWLAGAAAVLLLAIFGGWHEFHPAPQPAIATLAETGPQPSAAPAPAAVPSEPRPETTSAPTAAPAPAPDSGTGTGRWRVVAFTYNHREQAQAKAADLSQRHPDLHPEVFTPTGHAPFLVALGGPMNRDQAEAFKRHVRSIGLPRDTYAQNYSGSRR